MPSKKWTEEEVKALVGKDAWWYCPGCGATHAGYIKAPLRLPNIEEYGLLFEVEDLEDHDELTFKKTDFLQKKLLFEDPK